MKKLLTWLLVFTLIIACIPPTFAEGVIAPVVKDAIPFDGGLIALMSDGTVRVVEDERLTMDYSFSYFSHEECTSWTDITQLVASKSTLVGLRSDGTVVAEAPTEHYFEGDTDAAAELATWEHVTELYTMGGDRDMIAGITENGDILMLGIYEPNDKYYKEQGVPTLYETIASWKNVKKLNLGACAAGPYAVALHRDGILSTWIYDIGWSGAPENIIDLDCSGWSLIALKEDGTCVVNGEDSGFRVITDTWTDLKQVGCGDTMAMGLKNDGTFVFTRSDVSPELLDLAGIDHFTCSVYNQIAAYRNDGTVDYFEGVADSGNEIVRSWTNIDRILFDYPTIVALRKDGTLISTEGEIVVK